MIRLLMLAGLIVGAYKFGETKAKMDEMDFFLTSSDNFGATYLYIDSTGAIIFTPDMNLGTQLSYWDATKLKHIIKKFSPATNLKLETVSGVLTAQQV